MLSNAFAAFGNILVAVDVHVLVYKSEPNGKQEGVVFWFSNIYFTLNTLYT